MLKNVCYVWCLFFGGLLLGLLVCVVYLLVVLLGFKYGEIQVGYGLEYEGWIVWDVVGVLYICVQSLEDGYFLFGYSYVRDCLWQMEFVCCYVGGMFFEVFGVKILLMDRFVCILGFWCIVEGIYVNLDVFMCVLL